MDNHCYDIDWEIQQMSLAIDYFEYNIDYNPLINEFEYYETLRKIEELQQKIESLKWEKENKLTYCDH